MLAVELFESDFKTNDLTLIDALRDFLPLAVKTLKLPNIPKISLEKSIEKSNVPTFGRFTNNDDHVYVHVSNRNPNDILRTLAHELVHFKQRTEHKLSSDSWHTGSPAENQAHELAGVVMRNFNSQFPQYLRMKPVILPGGGDVKELDETWTKKYKKSINCSNPKGFSQKAHCAARKARQAGKTTKSSSVSEGKRCDAKGAVPELKAALDKRKKELNKLSDKQVYNKIDKIMTRIANTYDLTGQELHDMWTKKYGEIPDTYIIENFADGKNPGRKGLAKRSGVNCKASVTQLRKVAKNSTGEKRRMAHWCANMKSGRSKVSEEQTFDHLTNKKLRRILLSGPKNIDEVVWAMEFTQDALSDDYNDEMIPSSVFDARNRAYEQAEAAFHDEDGEFNPDADVDATLTHLRKFWSV